MIYGCNLAETEDGKTLINGIAELTSADVAASNDPTGSSKFGGDWELEYHLGPVEAQPMLGFSDGTDWQGLLAGNNDPQITSDGGGATAAIGVAENTTAVTTVTATDLDGDPLGYLIAGGADAAKFSINPSSGQLTFLTAPDYESPSDANGDNVYEVIVGVSDGVGGTDSQDISAIVTNNPRVYDQFNAVSYSGNDGDQNWQTSWTELDESNGPGSGVVQVSSSGYMEIVFPLLGSITDNGAARAADLSGASTAVLTFNYQLSALNLGSIALDVSSDGGSNWT